MNIAIIVLIVVILIAITVGVVVFILHKSKSVATTTQAAPTTPGASPTTTKTSIPTPAPYKKFVFKVVKTGKYYCFGVMAQSSSIQDAAMFYTDNYNPNGDYIIYSKDYNGNYDYFGNYMTDGRGNGIVITSVDLGTITIFNANWAEGGDAPHTSFVDIGDVRDMKAATAAAMNNPNYQLIPVFL